MYGPDIPTGMSGLYQRKEKRNEQNDNVCQTDAVGDSRQQRPCLWGTCSFVCSSLPVSHARSSCRSHPTECSCGAASTGLARLSGESFFASGGNVLRGGLGRWRTPRQG